MPNAHDAHNLFKLANSLAKYVDDNEKVSLPLFSVKLAKAQAAYPEDHTIGMMNRVVDKMANSSKLTISRAEVKDLYEKFYSRNSKFAQIFADELGKPVEVESVPVIQVENSVTDLIQDGIDQLVDPVLASALDAAFGGNSIKPYNARVAKHAASICGNRFKDLGFRVTSEVICGRDHILVCAVGFETPRGTTTVLVPVESDDEKVIYSPSVFVGNEGSTNIDKDTVIAYVTSRAGEKLNITAQEVLNAAVFAKGGDRDISDVELAITKLNAKKESQQDYSGPQILGVQVESANPNLMLELPLVEDAEIQSIASKFDSDLGFAVFKFGSKLVDLGKYYIAQKLQADGIPNFNIALSSSNEDSLMYSVALNGGSIAFKVPMKIENDTLFPPTVLLCNGSVKSFEASSINSLLREQGFDRTAASAASPLYGLKASQLVNTVRQAISEGNYVKAEDALNILSNGDDDKAYAVAMNIFNRGLTNKEEPVEEISKCAMAVKSNHSQFVLCGHTGLPLHKVYQDKYGNCQPMYRKGMAESYEGASFMDSKVYL